MGIKDLLDLKNKGPEGNVDVVNIQCPNCKSNLRIDNGVDLCNCQYCGAQVKVSGQSSKIVGARILSKTVDKYYEAKQQKLEAKRQEEIRRQEEAAKSRKRTLIALPILVLVYAAIFFGMKASSNKAEAKLEELSTQIQADIDAGNYDKALVEASQLQYTGNWSDDIEKKWDDTREAYISVINEKTGKAEKAEKPDEPAAEVPVKQEEPAEEPDEKETVPEPVVEPEEKEIEVTVEMVEAEASSEAPETVVSEEDTALAYVNMGDEYWSYYLIDFEEGTIRSFFTNDTGVFKGTIEGGDLNEGLTVKYSVDGDERTEVLHWHYKDQDSTLLVEDPNGFTFKFQKTSTDSAREVLSQDGYHDYE